MFTEPTLATALDSAGTCNATAAQSVTACPDWQRCQLAITCGKVGERTVKNDPLSASTERRWRILDLQRRKGKKLLAGAPSSCLSLGKARGRKREDALWKAEEKDERKSRNGDRVREILED
ncbi:hypothetical protein R1flu_009832 [Riccia fluitans]|uniref:Uncharacterized protein n=1 Tax=Riccia fluitans TaxID=41844 RepID=A0ABD1Z412_9MARC